MELLGDHRLSWVALQSRCREIKERGVDHVDRPRRDRVAEADVDLERNAGVAQQCFQSDANALVQVVFFDLFGLNAFGLINESVRLHFLGDDFADRLCHSIGIRHTRAEQIDILGSSMRPTAPQLKKNCTFENE